MTLKIAVFLLAHAAFVASTLAMGLAVAEPQAELDQPVVVSAGPQPA